MARLIPGINFTGSVGNLSAYKMRGVDGIVLRKKGGASKKTIKNSPSFAYTRRLNTEFSGRSNASRLIMRSLWPLKALADYNIAGPLNALMKPVQELDNTSVIGERHIILSKNPAILQGFSLNRQTILESVVRAPITCVITKDSLQAEVNIPALLPGINFKSAGKHPMYSFMAVLGLIPDLFYSRGGYAPSHKNFSHAGFVIAETSWSPVLEKSVATTMSLQLKTIPPDNNFTLILSVGIRYGVVGGSSAIEQAKYAGCAKVLMLS